MPSPELDAFGDPIEEGQIQDPAASSDEDPTPEGVDGQQEEDGDDKRSKFIPRDRFDQVNNKAAQLEQELSLLRTQAYQMATMLQQQQQPNDRQPRPELDDDIMRRLKPYMDADRELDRRELGQLRQIVGELSAVTEATRGWSYIADNVPDWKDLGKEVIKYVEGLPRALQQATRQDPEAMVHAANIVRERLTKGKTGDEEAVRESLRTRAHSEGSPAGLSGRKPAKDWATMDSETFRKEQARIQAQKQRGYIPPDDSW